VVNELGKYKKRTFAAIHEMDNFLSSDHSVIISFRTGRPDRMNALVDTL
jgi:hypothetical protein